MKTRNLLIQIRKKLSVNLLLNDLKVLKRNEPKPYEAVPGPKELPIVGNSWRFLPVIGQHRIQELDHVMKFLHEKYGKIAKVGGLIGHPDLLFIFDGDEIRNVFLREEKMPHRPTMPSLQQYKMSLQKEFFGDTLGIIAVHGVLWDNFRSKVQQIMMQPNAAKFYVEPLQEIATDYIQSLENSLDENRETSGNFLHRMYTWSLECVGQISLDTRLGCVVKHGDPNPEAKKIVESINTFLWSVTEVELRFPVWRFYKTETYKKYINALDSFRVLCMTHINKAMEKLNSEANDGKSISLLETILRKTNDPKVAIALALDLMLVGVDTASVATTTTIYQLSKNLDKQEILFNELQSILKDPNSTVTFEMLDKFQYLKACIREALRMYPVVIGNGRILQSDAIISGYQIPKGTCVIFPHYVLSNTEQYFDEPSKFEPERWLKSKSDKTAKCPFQTRKIHPFVSLPFGYGRRTCLGKRFAEAEMLVLLANLFRKYKVKYNYGDVSYKVNPSYVPDRALKFQMLKRND